MSLGGVLSGGSGVGAVCLSLETRPLTVRPSPTPSGLSSEGGLTDEVSTPPLVPRLEEKPLSSKSPYIDISVKSIVLAVSSLPYLETEPGLQAGLAASQRRESRGGTLQNSVVEATTDPVTPRYAHVPCVLVHLRLSYPRC